MIGTRNEAEVGVKVVTVLRAWEIGGDVPRLEGEVRRYDGSDAQNLKVREQENSRLKTLLAESLLDRAYSRR